MFEYDILFRAFRRLKSYCLKKVGCCKCRFQTEDGCMFAQGFIPADWEMPKKEG